MSGKVPIRMEEDVDRQFLPSELLTYLLHDVVTVYSGHDSLLFMLIYTLHLFHLHITQFVRTSYYR